MAQTLKTQTKAVTKGAVKAPAKAPAKAKSPVKAKTSAAVPTLTAMIVEGIATRIAAGSAFYRTALAYHARNKTQFPRARNNAVRAALTKDDVAQVFTLHDKKILASGNAKGQAMLDVFMIAKP